MSKSVIFHLGYPKAGSKSIQNFIHKNLTPLSNHGFYYPHYVDGQWFGNGLDIINLVRNEFKKQNLLELFKKDIDDAAGKTIIYSHESLFNQLFDDHLKLIQEVFDDIYFMIYVRRQDIWLESYYKWMITAGYELDIDYKLSKLPLLQLGDYRTKILSFQKYTKKENMIIRPFEVQQFYQGDLGKDFLHAIKIFDQDFSDFEFLSRRLNISLEGYLLEYKRKINKFLNADPIISAGRKFDEGWKGIKLSNLLREYRRENNIPKIDFLSPTLKLQIIDYFSEVNQWVANNYLDQPDGKLFKSDLPKPDGEEFSWPGLTLERAKEINHFIFEKLIHEDSTEVDEVLEKFVEIFMSKL